MTLRIFLTNYDSFLFFSRILHPQEHHIRRNIFVCVRYKLAYLRRSVIILFSTHGCVLTHSGRFYRSFFSSSRFLCSALLIYLFSTRHGCVYRYSWEIFGSNSNHSQSEWVLRYPSPSNHIQEGAGAIITSKNRETDAD